MRPEEFTIWDGKVGVLKSEYGELAMVKCQSYSPSVTGAGVGAGGSVAPVAAATRFPG